MSRKSRRSEKIKKNKKIGIFLQSAGFVLLGLGFSMVLEPHMGVYSGAFTGLGIFLGSMNLGFHMGRGEFD